MRRNRLIWLLISKMLTLSGNSRFRQVWAPDNRDTSWIQMLSAISCMRNVCGWRVGEGWVEKGERIKKRKRKGKKTDRHRQQCGE